MISVDEPDHARLRGLVSKAFTPRFIEELRPHIQGIADELLDKVQDSGKMDIVHIGLFLHLFDLDGQRKICERIVRLLKNEKGVLVLGTQVGSTKPKDVPFGVAKNVFRHDETTFEKLWKEEICRRE